MRDFFDSYEIRARIAPALAVLAPLATPVVNYLPTELPYWVTAFFFLTVPLIISTLVRDVGKHIESRLFAKWGGKPTSILLRQGDNTIEPALKRRYYKNLQQIVPEFVIPTAEFEKENLAAADRAYESAVRHIIELTSNKEEFRKIYVHNRDYGFRRNLIALRIPGMASSLIGISVGAFSIVQYGCSVISIASISCGVLFGTFFFIRLTPEYVRVAAFSYATHLIAATDTLVKSISKT